MSLRTKVKAWLAGALVLIAGGTAIVTALLQSAQQVGLTCDDARKIATYLETRDPPSPYLIPFVDHVVPEACGVTYTPKCTRRPDGTFCRKGLIYGPGIGGTYPDGTRATCDLTEGDPIPCTAQDGWEPSTYDKTTFDKQAFVDRLIRLVAREGLLDEAGD